MNPNLPPSNASGERFTTPPANPGIRPTGMNHFDNAQKIGPVRMEQNRPVGRYQQQNAQQHYVMQQNHPRQQPPNVRFSNEDVFKQQNMPPYNNSIQNIPRGPGVVHEGQNIQMAQMRFPGMQQPMRMPFNPNGGIPPNQPGFQNYQRMVPPRPPDDLIQGNMQNRENYKAQKPGEPPPALLRKPSDLKLNDSNQRPNEIHPQMQGQTDNTSSSATLERKSDPSNTQIPVSGTTGPKTQPAEINSTDKKADLESSEKVTPEDGKNKEKAGRKNKAAEDINVTTGMVQKNIKFFEENDTSKTPLKPEMPAVKKKEKVTFLPADVVKCDTHKDDYESGVDETPVVHPNLGSIFQVPRKVAKIPHLKRGKNFRKIKSRQPPEVCSSKSQIYRRAAVSESLRPRHTHLPLKLGGRKAQKNLKYGSKEELLAFFENTKTWREMKRYASSDEKKSKEKIGRRVTSQEGPRTARKTPTKPQTPTRRALSESPTKPRIKSPISPCFPGTPATPSTPAGRSKSPDHSTPTTPLGKRVPMNKIQVGCAPSPNLMRVKSKIGSLENAAHKPGGGNVKIENRKLDVSCVQPRTEAKNEQYRPSGGDKKIQHVKLQWAAKSKVGSLENAGHKPAGGYRKIETVKLDFKEKAKAKVGSKDNVKHVPGGGNVRIECQKLEFRAESKVGSMANIKHKPGGGNIKIFDDKSYLRQISGVCTEGQSSGNQDSDDLSVVRQVEGRSAPSTPGRRTSVKIKKITTIESPEEAPKVKNVTEVIVTSQTPKKGNQIEKSPTKQHVKVTYSKVSKVSGEDSAEPVGIIRLPANKDAPVLKPGLSKRDAFESPETGKQTKGGENEAAFGKTYTNVRNSGSLKQDTASPNLPEGKSNLRDELGLSKFLKDEIATQEKVGEIWREQNSMKGKSNTFSNREVEEKQKEPLETSLLTNFGSRSNQPFVSPETKTDTQINLNDSLRLNFYSKQNIQAEQQFAPSSLFVQNQQQHQTVNQQRSLFPS